MSKNDLPQQAETNEITEAPKKRKRRLGDRPDGYRLRSLQPMSKVSPYIMPNRNGACVYFHDSYEVTDLMRKYINDKRKVQGLSGFGQMHLLLASYVRVVSQRPSVNRFLSGQRVYSHDDDIVILLTIKREMTLDAEETIVKLHCTPTDTADDVYRKLTALIDENRQENPDSNFDNTAKIFNYIPGVLLKNAVWFLKLLDYFGLLPKSLIEVSPFHGSLFLTSMASLGIPPVYHHLYDFGNIPAFLSFGAPYKVNELSADGTVQQRKYIDYNVVCDERICDGYNLASAFKQMKSFLKNPYILDEKPEVVRHDVD